MADKKPTRYEGIYHLVRPSKMFNVLSLEPHVAEGRLVMPYRYFPGPVATRFFVELRDRKKIFGIRCPNCKIVYVPPEPICGRCFEHTVDWIELGREGVLKSYTVTYYRLRIHPIPVPVTYGIIYLDGASTGLVHLLAEVDEPLKIGMRVEAVFREKRQGNILDIRHFRPVRR